MQGLHDMAALFGGIEELAVDENEAESLARAILDVAKKRKLKPNPELLAWGNFAAVSLTLYAPRLIAFLAKRRQARDIKPMPVVMDVDAAGRMVPQMPN